MDTAAPGSPELAEARATGEARPASREGEAAAEEEDVSLADASGTVGIPDVFLEHLHGTWKNTTTQGIEGYLKHLGEARRALVEGGAGSIAEGRVERGGVVPCASYPVHPIPCIPSRAPHPVHPIPCITSRASHPVHNIPCIPSRA